MAVQHSNQRYANAFTKFVVVFEIFIITIYCFVTEYTEHGTEAEAQLLVDAHYAKFQDVHVMIFIGFGFLMTFLKKYGWSAVGYNFALSTFVIQLAILTNGFFEQIFHTDFDLAQLHKIPIDVTTLIRGDFAAGAVMITFGALIGKTSLLEMFIIATFEMMFYGLNEQIVATKLKVSDIGGSLLVHTFGAYFGLAVSYLLTPKDKFEEKDENSSYSSDLFAMVGTVFLWMFWPSFNGALTTGYQQHRVVVNTVLSLTASCMVTFLMSINLRPHKKFNMVDVQNATLAGGVAVGASANLGIGPGFALLIGAVAGFVSVCGYTMLTPACLKCKLLHDTCGVHNLHGMPGVLGGLFATVATFLQAGGQSGEPAGSIWTAMASLGDNRSSEEQATYQALGIATTLGMAIVGGLFTGSIMRCLRALTGHSITNHFHDGDHWEHAFEMLEGHHNLISSIPPECEESPPKWGVETASLGPDVETGNSMASIVPAPRVGSTSPTSRVVMARHGSTEPAVADAETVVEPLNPVAMVALLSTKRGSSSTVVKPDTDSIFENVTVLTEEA